VRPVPALGRGAIGAVVAAALVLANGAAAQSVSPGYLPYTEFSPDDTPAKVALKRAYNETLQRYNQALYDYHVTLEQHDRLVEAYNRTTDPAERKTAREQAEALRTKLSALRRDVTGRATAVDDAWRRAVAGGVTISR